MPTIKPYRQSVTPEGQVGGQAQGSDFGGQGLQQIGQAVQGATGHLAHAIAIETRNQSVQEATDADLKITLLGMDLEQDLHQRVQNHKMGDPDFTDDAIEELTTKLDELRYTEEGEHRYETSLGQRTFAEKEARLAKTYSQGLGAAWAKVQGAHAVETFNALTAAHSNRVSIGENYLTVGNALQEYEQSVNTGVFMLMPAEKRDDLLRQGKGQIAQSAMDGYIRSNPKGAQASLQNGLLSDVLTKDQTSTLLDKAQTGVNMQDAENRLANEALEHATKLASESSAAEAANMYLTQRADPHYNPYQTQSALFAFMKTKPNMTGPQIMSMVGALDSDIKEAKSGSKEGNVDLDRRLFAKIAAGKMRDITEINQARAQPNHPISAAQHEELIKEWNTARTPEGRSLQVEMDRALKSVEPMIMPKDLTGVLADPQSGLRMEKLTHDLRVQMDKDRREGKDPYARLNPDSPDYMLTKDKLKRYVTPFLDRVREASQRLSEQQGLPKEPDGGVAPASQRKPGESILDWQKRTGQR